MPYQSGQVSVGTTATLVCSVGSAPHTDGVLINSSAAAFIGGSGVTASTGFPVVANTPVLVADDGRRTAGLRRCSACPRVAGSEGRKGAAAPAGCPSEARVPTCRERHLLGRAET
jgi:hypothetical protein